MYTWTFHVEKRKEDKAQAWIRRERLRGWGTGEDKDSGWGHSLSAELIVFVASLPSLAFPSFHLSLFLGKSGARWASKIPRSIWQKVTTNYVVLISHTSHCSLNVTLLPIICFTSLLPTCFLPRFLYSHPLLLTPFLLIYFYFFTSEFPPFWSFFFSLDHTAIYLPDPNNNFCPIFTEYLLGQELC